MNTPPQRYRRGTHPASIAALRVGTETAKAGALARQSAKQAAARAWRALNKPFFDALYGPEPRCTACGQTLPEDEQ